MQQDSEVQASIPTDATVIATSPRSYSLGTWLLGQAKSSDLWTKNSRQDKIGLKVQQEICNNKKAAEVER